MDGDTQFTFRVSEEGLKTIRANAKAAGMTVSAYIRESAKQTMPLKASVDRTWSFTPFSPDTWVTLYPPQTYTFTAPVGVTFQLFN